MIKAVILFSGSAHVTTSAAGPRWIDRHGVARFELRDSASDLFDPTGDLVSKCERWWIILPVGLFATNDCESGMAKT